jgi:hypothetical protein
MSSRYRPRIPHSPPIVSIGKRVGKIIFPGCERVHFWSAARIATLDLFGFWSVQQRRGEFTSNGVNLTTRRKRSAARFAPIPSNCDIVGHEARDEFNRWSEIIWLSEPPTGATNCGPRAGETGSCRIASGSLRSPGATIRCPHWGAGVDERAGFHPTRGAKKLSHSAPTSRLPLREYQSVPPAEFRRSCHPEPGR